MNKSKLTFQIKNKTLRNNQSFLKLKQKQQNFITKSVLSTWQMSYLEFLESTLSEWNSKNDIQDFFQL